MVPTGADVIFRERSYQIKKVSNVHVQTNFQNCAHTWAVFHRDTKKKQPSAWKHESPGTPQKNLSEFLLTLGNDIFFHNFILKNSIITVVEKNTWLIVAK